MRTIDEILDVVEYYRDGREIYVTCPHCGAIRELEAGEFKGEQFRDNLCKGWFAVSHQARKVAFPAEDA
jgi:phage terminase large subunit GpA-like protein